MYQKCPLCEGSGEMPDNLSKNSVVILCCVVCDGSRIISSLTGAPPKLSNKNNLQTSYRVDLVGDKLVITNMSSKDEKVVCTADAASCYIDITGSINDAKAFHDNKTFNYE